MAGRIRPVNVMCEEGVTERQMRAVLSGLNELLCLAAVDRQIEVRNFGVWRQPGWLAGNTLRPYQSVDWYVDYGLFHSNRRNQVRAHAVIDALVSEPWQQAEKHYDVVVLQSDLYDQNCSFVIGLALAGLGTVLSVNRFLQLEEDLQMECIKTETMHEVGHVFGLIPDSRIGNVEYSLGRHCTNECIMRQGLMVPGDWIRITRDRLVYQEPLCPQCLHDLRMHFREQF